ncbi:hypothetical protein R1sor_021204 [Riccia sorocarpa]|uniref:Uncharacterized protein n=1 Tax=Riccia sorocarpa TaxID=122646 RepID=A0ABD3GH49_9MARC
MSREHANRDLRLIMQEGREGGVLRLRVVGGDREVSLVISLSSFASASLLLCCGSWLSSFVIYGLLPLLLVFVCGSPLAVILQARSIARLMLASAAFSFLNTFVVESMVLVCAKIMVPTYEEVFTGASVNRSPISGMSYMLPLPVESVEGKARGEDLESCFNRVVFSLVQLSIVVHRSSPIGPLSGGGDLVLAEGAQPNARVISLDPVLGFPYRRIQFCLNVSS